MRVYLGAFPITPTYKNIHGKFSVKYSLNMVLVDEEDRRYFKQTEYARDDFRKSHYSQHHFLA